MTTIAILTDTPQPGERLNTSYGLSAPIASTDFSGRAGLLCAPDSADPRATIRALKDRGTTHLWLCESVAGLSPLLDVGDWLVPDDYIDGTRGQHYTYFSDKAGGYVQQVPAFDAASRAALLTGVGTVAPRPFQRGVYVCVSSTRLETPAEALFWTRVGAHVAGRFLSPYLALARELDMAVAVLSVITRAGGAPGAALPIEHYSGALVGAFAALTV
ncbi:MAG: hypothetical protein HZC41_03435 [Chloroflexi bacterium]|nr:hypothetical protein [Chloroflexota bacterium]